MTDNITLPREVVEQLLKMLEMVEPYADQLTDYSSTASEWPLNLLPQKVGIAITALRTALAAEQPSKDDERYRKQKERSYRLQRLLKECVKVMQANAVFRDTKAHKDLKTRIRAELEDKT